MVPLSKHQRLFIYLFCLLMTQLPCLGVANPTKTVIGRPLLDTVNVACDPCCSLEPISAFSERGKIVHLHRVAEHPATDVLPGAGVVGSKDSHSVCSAMDLPSRPSSPTAATNKRSIPRQASAAFQPLRQWSTARAPDGAGLAWLGERRWILPFSSKRGEQASERKRLGAGDSEAPV